MNDELGELLRAGLHAIRAGVHPEDVAERLKSALSGGPHGTAYSYGIAALYSDIGDLARKEKGQRHTWFRRPYFGGCRYYCESCGISVEQDYPTKETEVTSGAYKSLSDKMWEADQEVPCKKEGA